MERKRMKYFCDFLMAGTVFAWKFHVLHCVKNTVIDYNNRIVARDKILYCV
jgi:hypothetical protein